MAENERRFPVLDIRLALLNLILNVFWSVLCLVPVYVFCAHDVTLALLYAFSAISLIPYLLPMSVLARMEISSSPATYRRLGVAFVNRFTQDGTLVLRFVKHPRPNRSVFVNPTAIAKLRRDSSQRERFHLAGFVFFLLLTGRAILLGKFGWALFLLLSNSIYNAYPVLLQQYIRLRLSRIFRQPGLERVQ